MELGCYTYRLSGYNRVNLAAKARTPHPTHSIRIFGIVALRRLVEPTYPTDSNPYAFDLPANLSENRDYWCRFRLLPCCN